MKIYLTLLQQRPSFRLLWIAQVISMGGDWFNTVAMFVLINRYVGTGAALGSVLVARSLPLFLFSPLAGVAADRYNRKAILLLTNLLRMIIVLGFLVVNSAEEVWLLYVLTVTQFTVSAFFEPAHAAILPTLVERDELLPANTLSSATWSAMLTIGAALGGLTTELVGVNTALVIDALTFGIAAILTIFIRMEHPEFSEHHSAGGWTDFIAGLRYVQQRPQIGWIAVVKGFGQFGNVDIIIGVYAREIFQVGDEGKIAIGLMFALHGLGAVVGPLVANRIGADQERLLYRWIIIGFMTYPIAWIMMAVPQFSIVLFGMFLRGVAGSINWTYSSVLLQTKVPDHYLGRVFGLDFTVFTLGMTLSVYLTGLAFDHLDVDPLMIPLGLAVLNIIPLTTWLLKNRQYIRSTAPTTVHGISLAD